jgi:hypothetical protein
MLLVLLVAAVVISAGGFATASNTGFKINKAMPLAGTLEIGNTWLSIPYFNPYPTWNAFCTATGLLSTGLATHASIVFQNPIDNFPAPGVLAGNLSSPVFCGTANGNTTTMPPGVGFRVRNATPGPASIIIVGSHNPTTTFTAYTTAGGGQRGSSWFAVPYHTTAVTANDLCVSAGLSASLSGRATVTRFDAATGQFSPAGSCGTGTASAIVLQLGEAVKIRETTTKTTTFVPAHF